MSETDRKPPSAEERANRIIGRCSPCPSPGYSGGSWGYWRRTVLCPVIADEIRKAEKRGREAMREEGRPHLEVIALHLYSGTNVGDAEKALSAIRALPSEPPK